MWGPVCDNLSVAFGEVLPKAIALREKWHGWAYGDIRALAERRRADLDSAYVRKCRTSSDYVLAGRCFEEALEACKAFGG
jgi:hypothetical protein